MRPDSLTDEQILQSAVFLTAVDDSAPSQVKEKKEFLILLRQLDKLMGTESFVVYWPNGIYTIVTVDPADLPARNRLLIDTYRQGERGVTGPLPLLKGGKK